MDKVKEENVDLSPSPSNSTSKSSNEQPPAGEDKPKPKLDGQDQIDEKDEEGIQSKLAKFERIFKEISATWNSGLKILVEDFDGRFPRGEIRDLRESDDYILGMEKLHQDLQLEIQKAVNIKATILETFAEVNKEYLKMSAKGNNKKIDSDIRDKFKNCKQKCIDVKAVLSNIRKRTSNVEYYAKMIKDEKATKALITNIKLDGLLLDWNESYVKYPFPGGTPMEIELKI